MTHKCGCIEGEYQCPIAVRAWQAVNDAYRGFGAAQHCHDKAITDKHWTQYQHRLNQYNKHYL